MPMQPYSDALVHITLQILIGMIAYILPATVTCCIVLSDLKNSHVREMF